MSRVRSLASTAKGRSAPRLAGAGRRARRLLKKVDRRLGRAVRKLDPPKPRPKPKPEPASPPEPKVRARRPIPTEFDEDARTIIDQVRPWTMTSMDKMFALITATRHIADAGIPGDVVECGVWRGGSMHAVARTLHSVGVTDKDLYLFDTFTGMTEPTERDIRIGEGDYASEMLESAGKDSRVWAVASLEDVHEGLQTLPYPQERFHLVKGPVEETVPDKAPATIALLRLDTDWYESTRHELEHLYERLQPGGVLIIDDYGSWQGAKDATDEFLAKLDRRPMLMRAGRARVGVKPGG